MRERLPAALDSPWRAELDVDDAGHMLVLPERRHFQLLARLVLGVGDGVLRALLLDLASLPLRRLPQLGSLVLVNWRQRLAGLKCAGDVFLLRVPRVRVARERLLGAQLTQGRGGGKLCRREDLRHARGGRRNLKADAGFFVLESLEYGAPGLEI